jgi:hypothetical protein
MQLHGEKQRLQFFARTFNMANRFETGSPVVGLGIRDEPNAVARENHSTEVFTVIVPPEAGIPRACSRRKVTADEPIVGLHVQILPHLCQQPFQGCQVTPQSRRRELGFPFSVDEVCPGTGKKRPPALTILDHSHLAFDLVGCQEIISIQPLDIVSLTEGESCVPRGGGALVRLADDENGFRAELIRDPQGLIARTVVHHNDLSLRPSLRNGGLDRICYPLLGIVGGNKYRYERLHRERKLDL